MSRTGVIVVCPTVFERRCLRRAQRDGRLPGSVRVETCGPGAAAIDSWSRRTSARDDLVILAGVAGAARERMESGAALAPGTAWIVGAVRDGDGHAWHPTCGTGSCVVHAAAEVVVTPSAKRALGASVGCDLIDLESVAFATVAEHRGWRWAVVRGVSDDVACSLPASIGEWVDGRGRPRPLRVAAAMLGRPSLAADVRTLHRHACRAMEAVAARISEVLEEA